MNLNYICRESINTTIQSRFYSTVRFVSDNIQVATGSVNVTTSVSRAINGSANDPAYVPISVRARNRIYDGILKFKANP